MQFVGDDQLAICTYTSVLVYHVTKEATHLLYKLTCKEWDSFPMPCGIAVSESMPDSILVICSRNQYVYQFKRCESVHYTEKHDMQVMPSCIAANNDSIYIGSSRGDRWIAMYNLPKFDGKRIVDLSFIPIELCIAAGYLVLVGPKEIIFKQSDDMDNDVGRIKVPEGQWFSGASSINDGRQLYVASRNHVHMCAWDGMGTLRYNDKGAIKIDHQLAAINDRGLALAADLLAVSTSGTTMVYSLK